jgi:ribose-phosphate pyrophosphokinase
MILLNNAQVNFTKFPNGETHIDIKDIDKGLENILSCTNIVKFKYEDDSDLIKLMFVKKHLDSCKKKAMLFIYYMPYSRMDRTEGQKVFTLKYVSEFINSLNFTDVLVYQPHSDVTPALLNRCRAINITENILSNVLDEVGFNSEFDYIYYPDASAEKHFGKSNNYKSLVGLKKRDFKSGRITDLQVVGELPTEKGFNVIMVDDLCSYGGTFQLGATKLRELGANKIYLVVTHCEKSIFEGNIFKTNLIDKVFTTDSILENLCETDKLSVRSIENGFLPKRQ